MSVMMGYNGGPGGAGAGGGGSSGDILYQESGCGLPTPYQETPYQDSSCGGLSPSFQDHHHHPMTHDPDPRHSLSSYGSDLDSLAGSSSSSHLPYSPEPEAPLYSDSLDYGLPVGNNMNNDTAPGGVGVGARHIGGDHADLSMGGNSVGVGGGGGGGGRSRRRRRSPPKAVIDINDNSLYSVYCIFKSILSASTASTVAIDNKIEQAMDLVKSHLMFAVREEVEVLKEKISELMERITQLEYENTVLRQYATQEALQQLQQPHHSSNT